MECMFCKIVKGEIPSYKIYEDKSIMVFLDIHPVSEGHTLVIPKKHYENIYDIPEKELKQIISVVKRLVLLYEKALGIKAVNIMHASGKAAQQDIFHFHIHLVPRHEDDKINLWYEGKNFVEKDFKKTLNKIKKHIRDID